MTPTERREQIDYASLAPHSRLLLALSALARSDDPMLARLRETAPHEVVSLQAGVLDGQLRCLRDIGGLFLITWHVGTHDYLAGLLAREKGAEPSLVAEGGATQTRGILACIGLLLGYRRFCEQNNLPAAEVLQVALGDAVARQVESWTDHQLKSGLELAGQPGSAMAGMISEAVERFAAGFVALWPPEYRAPAQGEAGAGAGPGT